MAGLTQAAGPRGRGLFYTRKTCFLSSDEQGNPYRIRAAACAAGAPSQLVGVFGVNFVSTSQALRPFMPVRPARAEDAESVLAMMAKLWPDEDPAGFLFEAERCFVWEREGGSLGGFAEVSVRPYVDGAESAPCPHVEAWWVDADLRRRGVGRALIAAIEDWARGQGFAELSSDALVANRRSRAAHAHLGFEATERIQYFRKRL